MRVGSQGRTDIAVRTRVLINNPSRSSGCESQGAQELYVGSLSLGMVLSGWIALNLTNSMKTEAI
jgi:hypothetical protein